MLFTLPGRDLVNPNFISVHRRYNQRGSTRIPRSKKKRDSEKNTKKTTTKHDMSKKLEIKASKSAPVSAFLIFFTFQ